MKKLRKQISESFFNPILHLLPILVFLIVDEFFGIDFAWKISFPVALITMIYVYIVYNNAFTWHLISTTVFLSTSLIVYIGYIFSNNLPNGVQHLLYKIVFVLFLLLYLIFRKIVQRFVLRIISKLIPMTNNFNELYRLVWWLFLLLSAYIICHVLLVSANLSNTSYHNELQYTFVGLLSILVVYEILRVQIIRSKLTQEEWWPIVSEQGKIIGSIQHLTSLNDENKYMHPIIRVLLIDKAMILMQKRAADGLIYPGLWDTVISNHVTMGETVEQCIERTAQRYSLTDFKYMHLSNYTLEVEKEKHYAFLSVSCQKADLKINTEFSEHLKWWTMQQIEEELDSGIFTENFKVEYDLLKRSGLLETGKCECSCKLKEAIYHHTPLDIKKDGV